MRHLRRANIVRSKRRWLAVLIAVAAVGVAAPHVVASSFVDGASRTAETTLPNNMGWRVGTEWTVKVQQYADYLAEPGWVTSEYRFRVVQADPAENAFTVSVRFADESLQPASARHDLLKAGYGVKNGSISLSWVQLDGRGPKIAAENARQTLPANLWSMELPANPFSGGKSVTARAPQLGQVPANEVAISMHETLTLARGAPWWLSYSNRAQRLKADLVTFSY